MMQRLHSLALQKRIRLLVVSLAVFLVVLATALDASLELAAALKVQHDLAAAVAAILPRISLFLLAGTVLGAAAAAAVLTALQQSVLAPLEAIQRSIAAGRSTEDGTAPASTGAGDDLRQLREEIERLIEESEARGRSLRAYKTEFERRVLERTAQLEQSVAEAHNATRQAEHADRAKADFLARMSHEIRTPLNGVLGMAELLQQSPKLDHRQQRYALVIHQSGKALLQLINDVLDFSKIEAEKLELDKERFCVREMVEDALEIMAERAQSKGLELICDVPVDIDTMVFADCLRLRQVIINLVGNAVKFTDRGDITIKVRTETGIETSRFTFEVIDTGIGISAEDCATIFEAFVQASSAARRRQGGTGLGLAISKQLVELMGGTIGVQSTVGEGSRFYFSVPLAVDRTADREKPVAALAQTRFLVVEKSEAARRMLRQHLRSWGAISTELSSADEALKRLRGGFPGEFDVLIIDAHLPGTTMTAMAAAVRATTAFCDIPILMMHTGPGEPPPEARQVTGPVAWQNKPIRRSQLQDALARLLGNARLAAAEPQNTASRGASRPARAGGALRVKRVLLVEDNAVNQEVAREMLESLGIDVHTADSGEDALTKLATGRFDAVLMDCEMPALDGYATTERFRQWEVQHGHARTPVVALTANALHGDDEKCFAAGMDHYLSKPFSTEQLHGVLELCLAPGEEPTASEPPAGAVLAEKTLQHIRELGAGRRTDLMPRLIALYTQTSAELLATLSSAASSGDLPSLRRAAHALKSSSSNVGATGLAQTCRELEWAARKGKGRLATFLVERVMREHQEIVRALGARAAGSAPTRTARAS